MPRPIDRVGRVVLGLMMVFAGLFILTFAGLVLWEALQ